MKKFLKWTAYAVIVLVLIAIAGVSYITLALPNVGQPEAIKVDATPQRIARGKYLANNVTVCLDCHSTRSWDKFAGPSDSTISGAGGEKFDASAGFPGTVYSPNITPLNLSGWTDGEIFRAMTTGVKKDGSAIFPIMPWPYYAKMDREDLYSIIAYIRTLKPSGKNYPGHQLDFPLNVIVHTMPRKAALGNIPNPADTVKYGAYLLNAAACKECHTQSDKGKLNEAMAFAGGQGYIVPGGSKVFSANITPDKETGIGSWTKEQFVSRFTQFANGKIQPTPVKPGEFQTIMPWWRYGSMKVSDLEAIYAYLKTIKPISNHVVKFENNIKSSAN
ncbi:cytochrome c [Mucilaginibacter sp. Mucisp84]|uniref:c-type cytochrome n=1 Tax=Mucilaginibacter sp. Mucisp84 TaxID=3243058 RepID=UPI0039A4271F